MIDFAALHLIFEFDGEDRPPAGTECAQCRQFGHWCPAKGYLTGYTLCLPCGRGEACGQLVAVDRIERGVASEMFEPDSFGAPGECRRIEIVDADRVIEEKPLASAWTLKESLDPENLVVVKAKKKGVAAGPVRKVEAKTSARAQPEAQQQPEAPAEVVVEEGIEMDIATSKAKAIAESRAGKSAYAIAKEMGETAYQIKKWVAEGNARSAKPEARAMAVKREKKAAIVVAAPVVAIEEMISVRVPVRALDRLIAMMPAELKGRAVEKLLAELEAR